MRVSRQQFAITIILLTALAERCEGESATVSDLISFLTYQSGRSKIELELPNRATSIGAYEANLATAQRLVKMGVKALPQLEDVLESLQREGAQSRFLVNSGWLLLVYARIKGPTACCRLRGLNAHSRTAFIRHSADRAIALSAPETPDWTFLHPHYRQPRDALDQLIRSWESDDRTAFESSLGPSAKDSLHSLIRDQGWTELRNRLTHGSVGGFRGIGYHFDGSEAWMRSDETLDVAYDYPAETGRYPKQVDSIVYFVHESGDECGRAPIKLVKADPLLNLLAGYVVDNTDLEILLRTISACAAK